MSQDEFEVLEEVIRYYDADIEKLEETLNDLKESREHFAHKLKMGLLRYANVNIEDTFYVPQSFMGKYPGYFKNSNPPYICKVVDVSTYGVDMETINTNPIVTFGVSFKELKMLNVFNINDLSEDEVDNLQSNSQKTHKTRTVIITKDEIIHAIESDGE